jgi:hypothetical protein
LFAKKMGGGSVNPPTGEFNFVVEEGYWVKHGKIVSPVRGATLIGKGCRSAPEDRPRRQNHVDGSRHVRFALRDRFPRTSASRASGSAHHNRRQGGAIE